MHLILYKTIIKVPVISQVSPLTFNSNKIFSKLSLLASIKSSDNYDTNKSKMNARNLNRPKSIGTFSLKSESEFISPYLKPIKNLNPNLKVKTQSQLFKKRVRTQLNSTTTNLSFTLSEIDQLPIKSLSSDVLLPSDSILQMDSSESKTGIFEEILTKLQHRLVNLTNGDYNETKSIFFDTFNELVASDFALGKILMMFKDTYVEMIKLRLMEKLRKVEEELQMQKQINSSFKTEKENLITKLNTLSSQNIDLMSTCEKLQKRIKIFDNDKSVNGCKDFSKAEVIEKDEQIKELTRKVREMGSHENKLLQIIQSFNISGMDIKKLYSQTPVKHDLFEIKKKRRLVVPEIDLAKLSANPSIIN